MWLWKFDDNFDIRRQLQHFENEMNRTLLRNKLAVQIHNCCSFTFLIYVELVVMVLVFCPLLDWPWSTWQMCSLTPKLIHLSKQFAEKKMKKVIFVISCASLCHQLQPSIVEVRCYIIRLLLTFLNISAVFLSNTMQCDNDEWSNPNTYLLQSEFFV